MARQRGFALTELTVAALLAVLLAVWGASSLVDRLNDSAAQSLAAWMSSARGALKAYLERHAHFLAAAPDGVGAGLAGYVEWRRPELGELKADGLLSPGYPEVGPSGMPLRMRVVRKGVCPGRDCLVEGLLFSGRPLMHKPGGQVDEAAMAQWLMSASGLGGAVTASRPERVAGQSFSFDNPPVAGEPALPVGTVALGVTSGQLGTLDYLRVADPRDPDFQGPLTVAGDVTARGVVNVQGYLRLDTAVDAYAACSPDGLIARERYGGLLLCRDGLWMPPARSAGGFSVNSLYGCRTRYGMSTANPATGACSCPWGHNAVLISDSGTHAAPEGQTTGYLCVG